MAESSDENLLEAAAAQLVRLQDDIRADAADLASRGRQDNDQLAALIGNVIAAAHRLERAVQSTHSEPSP